MDCYSIKSQLGSPSTLFNASGATNFTYNLSGHRLTDDEKVEFERFGRFKAKFDYLDGLNNAFKNYLYGNTRFDTPSKSKHGFGKVYEDENGEQYLKLNVQIRFVK